MITEKDLENSKFFTTSGDDMWRVKGVSTFTLVELVNCETGGTASAVKDGGKERRDHCRRAARPHGLQRGKNAGQTYHRERWINGEHRIA